MPLEDGETYSTKARQGATAWAGMTGPMEKLDALVAGHLEDRRHERSERRDHLRALAQRVEVNEGAVRIMGSKSNLLRKGAVPTLYRSGGEGGIRTLGRGISPFNRLAICPVQPLQHLSAWRSLREAESAARRQGYHDRAWFPRLGDNIV